MSLFLAALQMEPYVDYEGKLGAAAGEVSFTFRESLTW